MEGGLVLLGILLVVGLPVGAILGIIAFFTGRDQVRQIEELKKELSALRRQMEGTRAVGTPPRQQEAASTAASPSTPSAPASFPPPDSGVVAARGARSALLVDVPQRRVAPPPPRVVTACGTGGGVRIVAGKCADSTRDCGTISGSGVAPVIGAVITITITITIICTVTVISVHAGHPGVHAGGGAVTGVVTSTRRGEHRWAGHAQHCAISHAQRRTGTRVCCRQLL